MTTGTDQRRARVCCKTLVHQSFGCHIALEEEMAFFFLSPYLNICILFLVTWVLCREERVETAGGWVGG